MIGDAIFVQREYQKVSSIDSNKGKFGAKWQENFTATIKSVVASIRYLGIF